VTLSRYADYAIFGALAVAGVALLMARSGGPEIGGPAPDFALPLVDGEGEFKLAEHRGKRVVLEVFASWCGACRRVTPELAALHRELGDGVVFVGISVDDSPEQARAAKERWGIPYPVLLDDGSVAKDYDVSVLPTVIVIDEAGEIRHATNGAPSRAQLKRWLDAL
jgi:cytochrome c biogenesis protein CcmG/thiol:disulfide interchange protein DsbE